MENLGDKETLVITDAEAGERLDKILAARYFEVNSRTYFQNLIERESVLLNGEPVKKRARPSSGDEVEVCFLLTKEVNLTAENIPLDILYEDEYLLAVNKPSGMVVHPAPGNWSGTFVNALLYHCGTLQTDEDQYLRPGIVHRLDKNTSGVLLAAKTTLAHQKLIELFSQRKIYKEYLAICYGTVGSGVINAPIARHPKNRQKMAIVEEGKEAITIYETLKSNGKCSIVKLELKTGRTHQIRVHMQHLGTPVVGDPLYGRDPLKQKRQLLHAKKVEFIHPITQEQLIISAPIPDDIKHFI